MITPFAIIVLAVALAMLCASGPASDVVHDVGANVTLPRSAFDGSAVPNATLRSVLVSRRLEACMPKIERPQQPHQGSTHRSSNRDCNSDDNDVCDSGGNNEAT